MAKRKLTAIQQAVVEHAVVEQAIGHGITLPGPKVTNVENLLVEANGYIRLVDSNHQYTIELDGNRAYLFLGIDNPNEGYDPNFQGNEGDLRIRDGKGEDVFNFNGGTANLVIGAQGNGGAIVIRNDAGEGTIKLDGELGDVLLLGGDCAEEFDVVDEDAVDAGTVLVIEDEGALCPCRQAYDRRVAGVVSGANGLHPGIILGKSQALSTRQPVALSGKVFCKVDAQSGPIRVGDLLTTSSTPGHAMRASEPDKAFGAVIGKALRPLESGRGLIPILVALQ